MRNKRWNIIRPLALHLQSNPAQRWAELDGTQELTSSSFHCNGM